MALSKEQKEANKIERARLKAEAKTQARIEAEKSQRPVKELTISIEWKKSYMWGSNPKAEIRVSYHDGGYDYKDGYTASGCGYDKESTVIAQIFNEFLKYKLWNLTPEQRQGGNGSGSIGNAPYGIHVYSDNNPHYGGGIGTNCYYRIGTYIGGKFEHIASGKTFDAYKWTDNENM